MTGFSKVPFMKEWATDEIPENVDTSPELIKEAQQRCGEILWTTQRTRPDAAYAAMMMARLTIRDGQKELFRLPRRSCATTMPPRTPPLL